MRQRDFEIHLLTSLRCTHAAAAAAAAKDDVTNDNVVGEH